MRRWLYNLLLIIINIKVNILRYDKENKDGARMETEYVSRFRIFRMTITSEQRDDKGEDFKFFTHVYLFGVEILHWIYRDVYRRGVWVRTDYD